MVFILVRAKFCRKQSAAVFYFLSHVTPIGKVKHVSDNFGVSLFIGYKKHRSLLDHFSLAYLVTIMGAPNCTAVVQVGMYHSEVSLGFGFRSLVM